MLEPNRISRYAPYSRKTTSGAIGEGGAGSVPYIDYAADIKVTVAQTTVTAEIPLAGHASEHWMAFFRVLVSAQIQELRAEAADRENRAWVIVILPVGSTDLHPESTLDAVKTLISEANCMELNRDGFRASTQPVDTKPRTPSTVGGRVSNGSGQPARPDRCLEGCDCTVHYQHSCRSSCCFIGPCVTVGTSV